MIISDVLHICSTLLAVTAGLLLPQLLTAAAPKSAESRFSPTKLEQEIFDLVNAERKKAGLPPLQMEARLFAAARGHSANMAKQDKLAHELDGKGPKDRAGAAGYPGTYVGENVAMGQADAAAVMEAWMNSPGHRANILRKEYTEIGIGFAPNAAGRPYYTQVFGRQKQAQPPPTVRVQFAVRNASSDTAARVALFGTGQQVLIKPGETKTLEAARAGRLPTLKIFFGKMMSVETELVEGGRYVVASEDGESWTLAPDAEK